MASDNNDFHFIHKGWNVPFILWMKETHFMDKKSLGPTDTVDFITKCRIQEPQCIS